MNSIIIKQATLDNLKDIQVLSVNRDGAIWHYFYDVSKNPVPIDIFF